MITLTLYSVVMFYSCYLCREAVETWQEFVLALIPTYLFGMSLYVGI